MSTAEHRPAPGRGPGEAGGRPPALLAGAAAVGLAGVLAAFFLAAPSPERFWTNWVFWFLYVVTIGLGALFLVAIEHLAGARWSIPVRRSAERVSGLIVLASPAALIALLSLKHIYPWATPEGLSVPIVAAKAGWLNVPFFSVRVVVCLALWILSWRILAGGSLRQDGTRDPAISARSRKFAPAFMAIFAFTITLVAFDWISSLEPEWYSDIFGVYIFAGSFLGGLAATVLVVLHLMARGRLPGVRFDHLYNLGGFLFAFTVFWSYIGFAQYMLIWYANVPEEIVWYQHRIDGSWRFLVLALAVLHFCIPFFALVPRDAKGDPRRLRWVAMTVLLAHALDLYWMVFPVLGASPVFGIWEVSFGLFFVSASLLWIRRSMARGADMPVGDPLLKEGLEFRL